MLISTVYVQIEDVQREGDFVWYLHHHDFVPGKRRLNSQGCINSKLKLG